LCSDVSGRVVQEYEDLVVIAEVTDRDYGAEVDRIEVAGVAEVQNQRRQCM
jgi:ACT domain-containing protein